MAGKTISQLPLATTPLAGTESVPIVRSGVTYKTTVADIAKSPQDGATANAVTYYDGSKMPTSSAAFTFDGTNVVTTGTSSATKLIPTGGTATGNGMYLPASNTIGFSTNGTLGLVLDASQNLGLGVTPSAWNSGYRALQIGSGVSLWGTASGATGTYLSNNVLFNASGNRTYLYTGTAAEYAQSGGAHYWATAPSGTAGNTITFTQAMTLDASGNLLVGATSLSGTTGKIRAPATSGSNAAYSSQLTNTSTATVFECTNSSGSYIGGISCSNTATSFPTSSDVRLKKNIVDAGSASAKVDQIRIVSHGWKHDDEIVEFGVIAQELASVAPQAVMVGDDGNEIRTIWSVDYSKLVPMLIKAHQEQQAIITALTARVVALEAKQAA